MAAPIPPTNGAEPADRHLRILVVDDHPVNLRVMEAVLLELDHGALFADCGEAAAAMAKASPFDLILVDLHMPGLGGDETTRLIRAGGASAGAFIVQWTTDDGARLDSALYDGRLAKPAALDEVERVVREAAWRAEGAGERRTAPAQPSFGQRRTPV